MLLFAVSISSAFAQKIYKVGDYYNDGTKEGVVFWVDATGQHGKIVSMSESKSSKWASVVSEQNRNIGASNRGNGGNNMSAVKNRPNWRVTYPAFAWCANLGAGWYLPSIGELEVLLLNDSVHDAVNRTLNSKGASPLVSRGEPQFYWSSTENVTVNGAYTAWCIIMTRGTVDGEFYKEYPGYVRAVATF